MLSILLVTAMIGGPYDMGSKVSYKMSGCNPDCTCQDTGVCICHGKPQACLCLHCNCLSYDEVMPQAAKSRQHVVAFVNVPVRKVPGVAVCNANGKYTGSGIVILQPNAKGWFGEKVILPATATNADIQRVLNPPVVHYQPYIAPPMSFGMFGGGFGGGMDCGPSG